MLKYTSHTTFIKLPQDENKIFVFPDDISGDDYFFIITGRGLVIMEAIIDCHNLIGKRQVATSNFPTLQELLVTECNKASLVMNAQKEVIKEFLLSLGDSLEEDWGWTLEKTNKALPTFMKEGWKLEAEMDNSNYNYVNVFGACLSPDLNLPVKEIVEYLKNQEVDIDFIPEKRDSEGNLSVWYHILPLLLVFII